MIEVTEKMRRAAALELGICPKCGEPLTINGCADEELSGLCNVCKVNYLLPFDNCCDAA